jgi:hypothetical protein
LKRRSTIEILADGRALEVRRADVKRKAQKRHALVLCDLDCDHPLDRVEVLAEIVG